MWSLQHNEYDLTVIFTISGSFAKVLKVLQIKLRHLLICITTPVKRSHDNIA